MGIPKTTTVKQAGSDAWSFLPTDHFTQPVFKQGLPVDAAEDNEGHEIRKYDVLESTRNIFTDGVFLGNVWGDAVNRNSLFCSYSAGVLTVQPGRAIVGQRRVDVGLSGTYDQPYTESIALPTAGNEIVVYIQVYERSVTGTVYFTPAGASANRSKYFDQTADIKHYTGVAAAGFAPPNSPDTNSQAFLEIGRISDAGVVSDTRVLSLAKSAKNPYQIGFIVAQYGTIGVDCTHTDLASAVTDLNSNTFINDSVGYGPTLIKYLWIRSGGYSVTNLALPTNVVIIGTSPDKLTSNLFQNVETASPHTNFPGVPVGITFIGNSSNSTPIFTTNAPLKIYNTSLSGAGGGILSSSLSTDYYSCFLWTPTASILWGNFYDCVINCATTVSGTQICKFIRCEIIVSVVGGNMIFTSGGTIDNPHEFVDCKISITRNNKSITVTAGYVVFRNCYIHYDGSGVGANAAFNLNGGTSIFEKCKFESVQFGGTGNDSIFIIGNTTKFTNCSFNSIYDEILCRFTGGTTEFYGCRIINTAAGNTAIMFKQLSSYGASTLRFYNSTVIASGSDILIGVQGDTTSNNLTCEIYNSIMKSTSNHVIKSNNLAVGYGGTIYIKISNSLIENTGTGVGCFCGFSFTPTVAATIGIDIYNSTIIADNGIPLSGSNASATATYNFHTRHSSIECIAGANVAFNMLLSAGTNVVDLFGCIFNSRANAASINATGTIAITNSTYKGAITGGATISNQTTGSGTNAGNVLV